MHLFILLLLTLMALPAFSLDFTGTDLDGRPCTGRDQGVGPFDYTNPHDIRDTNKIPIVEKHHFTPQVEQLIKGESGYLLGDIDYTLRAIPNHHRALFAIIRFVTEPRTRPSSYGHQASPPECYLQRALRFKPDDGRVHLLFGLYLHKLGKLTDAEEYYRKALKLMPNDAEAHYNLALALLDQGKTSEAAIEAKKAYAAGYPLPGLRDRLVKSGHPLKP